jgi:pimeloyl-ACP methyl ester carboxylesterase
MNGTRTILGIALVFMVNELVWAAKIPADIPQEAYELRHHTIRQPLDHSAPDGPSFEQHYDVIVPEGAPADAPVFYVYGNESPATQENLESVYRTYPRDVAAIFIQGEHRGYGQSISDDPDQSVPSYVRIDQAHADTHRLIVELKRDFTGPWIMAGYSYGGGMVIDFAAAYPDDVDAILSSSGVVDWPFEMNAYDQQVRDTLGEATYARLVGHMNNLEPEVDFDAAWLEREFVIAMVHGVVQMGSIRRMQGAFSEFTKLSTPEFLEKLHGLDKAFAKGMAWQYAVSNAKLTLSREEKLTNEYDWRVWRYQQCMETGVFEVSAGEPGIFTRSRADFCNECEALFGEYQADGTRWSPRDALSRLSVPMVYVSGRKDPWDGLGIRTDDDVPGMVYLQSPEGQHCPDRDDRVLARQVFDVLLAAVSPKPKP